MSIDKSAEVQERVNCTAYAVLYNLVQQEWVVIGSGWSEVHLYFDEQTQKYHVAGWRPSEDDVLLDVELSPKCRYYQKTEDFHKFVGPDHTVYGFGFHPSVDGLAQAKKFLQLVRKALDPDMNSSLSLTATLPSMTPSSHSVLRMDKDQRLALGTLEIKKAKTARNKHTGSLEMDNHISDPVAVSHTRHVTYDPATNQYVGLPAEWAALLSKQFGEPPAVVEAVKLEGYESRIPCVLVNLRRQFIEQGGAKVEGVFRLAPNSALCEKVKEEIQNGTFRSCDDVHVLANLIKVYYRDMPEALLDIVDTEQLSNCANADDVNRLIASMPSLQRSLLLWLLDLCVEVSSHFRVNLMGPKNLAIVVAPNLFRAGNLDPMESLMYSQKVANFVCLAIQARALQ